MKKTGGRKSLVRLPLKQYLRGQPDWQAITKTCQDGLCRYLNTKYTISAMQDGLSNMRKISELTVQDINPRIRELEDFFLKAT
jgi:hypothetical protein